MCYLVQLSGGIGFHDMCYREAEDAAKELGAVREVVATFKRTNGTCSVSFMDKDNKEVFYWSYLMQAGQVFDPPRECSEYFQSHYEV